MEIRWLEDFIVLEKTRHFSRAAIEQNVTQPTFSRRIKLLEQEVGVTLIDRNSLPLSLTPAGEIFLGAAKKIVQTAQETKRRCHEVRETELNRLSFATTQSLYLSIYQSWLKPFSDKIEVDVDLTLESTTWLINDFITALKQQQCDLMLCYWSPDIEEFNALNSEEYECLQIYDEWMIPVSAVDKTGQAIYQLPGSKRQPLPYIGYHEKTVLGPLLKHFLSQCEQLPYLTTMNENMHASGVHRMIEEGFGIGWVIQRLVQKSLTEGTLVTTDDEKWKVPLEVRLYRLKHNTNPNLSIFWENIKTNLVENQV